MFKKNHIRGSRVVGRLKVVSCNSPSARALSNWLSLQPNVTTKYRRIPPDYPAQPRSARPRPLVPARTSLDGIRNTGGSSKIFLFSPAQFISPWARP